MSFEMPAGPKPFNDENLVNPWEPPPYEDDDSEEGGVNVDVDGSEGGKFDSWRLSNFGGDSESEALDGVAMIGDDEGFLVTAPENMGKRGITERSHFASSSSTSTNSKSYLVVSKQRVDTRAVEQYGLIWKDGHEAGEILLDPHTEPFHNRTNSACSTSIQAESDTEGGGSDGTCTKPDLEPEARSQYQDAAPEPEEEKVETPRSPSAIRSVASMLRNALTPFGSGDNHQENE
ncbi:hypothetical protein MKZ38_006583 [Zalerion maritima]|uniref:Uncharacterized protein n=1 Tax=Zalerion maritima TaxID=339359 RepID=A0AAD5WPL5_9PEZI|nr:hypothetical protein MKZ38_006583 [Zalerion maritima]